MYRRIYGSYRHKGNLYPLRDFSPQTSQNVHKNIRVRMGEQRKHPKVAQVCEGGTKAPRGGERGRAANLAGPEGGEGKQRNPPSLREGQEVLSHTGTTKTPGRVCLPRGGGEDY